MNDKISPEKVKSNEEKAALLESKFDEIQADQEKNLLLDFDQAIEEIREEPLTVKFAGKYFDVPRQMPFRFATFFFRYCYKKVNGKIVVDVPEDRVFQFVRLMFGDEMIRALERPDVNISIDKVFEVLAIKILDKWGYGISKSKAQEKKI